MEFDLRSKITILLKQQSGFRNTEVPDKGILLKCNKEEMDGDFENHPVWTGEESGLWSVQNREFLLYIHWFAVVASQALC